MKISIITVCLNSATALEKTLASVAEQSYRDVEHIIIDGGSTDGTLAVLERYRSGIACLVSEPDNGIYDAMNKGIALATGEVVGILNAGDIYASDDALERIGAAFANARTEACYSDLAYRHPLKPGRTVRFWKAGGFARRKLYFGWMPPHPTFFVRRICYTAYGIYRTDLGSSADYELMLRYLLKHGVTPVYLPGVLVYMQTGGISNASLRQRIRAHMMDWRAWQVNNLSPYPWTVLLKPLRKLHQWFIKE